MIDFHSHILSGIDDGSRSLQQTEQMLRAAYEQGVTEVLATPHFYASSDSIPRFLEKREKAFLQVQELAERESWVPKIRVGAEVYYFPNMGKAELLPELCLEGTSILLLELPFVQWDNRIYEDVLRIIEKQKLTVILAHIERYYEFQKKKTVWNDILDLPVYLQINAGSLQDRKKRKLDLKLLKEEYPIVLGSDCHNMERRPPNLKEGRDFLQKKMGDDVLKTIDELGRRILGEYE